ncbi:unnamed protein product [Trifolium pratense]|uniref:Uncharacterized protein n=1 Tax=Trifolium pratense TaxID=57577 RepID=A0ACB0KAB5_TRIPR|nr:unnamed protein product [Trifolium pratense]
MNSNELLPHEHDYALFLSYVYDLWHYDPMILDMVSERYPRDEDAYASVEDSAAYSNSAIAEDEDLSHDEDTAISAPEVHSSSLCNHIHFGNFGNSNLSTIQFPLITPIKPTIDGFTIKIGEITCILVDSCCSIVEESAFQESEFAASEEHMKSKNLDSASSSLLTTSEITIKPLVEGGGSVKIGELDCFLSVYETESACKGKTQDLDIQHLISALKIHHSEAIMKLKEPFPESTHIMYDPRRDKYSIAVLAVETVFDPGGATFVILGYVICRVLCKTLFRLRWMPWDRGRKTFDPGGTLMYIDITVLHRVHAFHFSVSIAASSSLVHVDKDVSAKASELFTRDDSYEQE